MSLEDKVKWENKYKNEINLLSNRPHSIKLDLAIKYTNGKKAIDLACGLGRNVIHLAKNDFFVEAYDISKTALDNIDKLKIDNITTKEVDLDSFFPNYIDSDLVIMTNFLDRKLIRNISTTMKKGSIFFVETFMNHEINEKKHSNPDFLLSENELKTMFIVHFEILDYDVYENEANEQFRMMKQSIIARKI
ncbi:MAG: tellurium resistance protein TehB [Sulfurovum sp.]|jgi:SAM-dependent methyltransferase